MHLKSKSHILLDGNGDGLFTIIVTMWMSRGLLAFIIIALFTLINQSLASENVFFFISRSEPACFVDDLMETATLLLKYKHEDFKTKPLQLKVLLKGMVIKTAKLDRKEGRFAFAAEQTGVYRVCIEADQNGFPPIGQAKFYLHTQVLANSVQEDVEAQLPEVAKQKQVVSLQEELVKVAENVEVLLQKVQLARERETHFRDQSERINERVVWWSIAQTIVLIIAGAFQSVHLHNFFLAKKIA